MKNNEKLVVTLLTHLYDPQSPLTFFCKVETDNYLNIAHAMIDFFHYSSLRIPDHAYKNQWGLKAYGESLVGKKLRFSKLEPYIYYAPSTTIEILNDTDDTLSQITKEEENKK